MVGIVSVCVMTSFSHNAHVHTCFISPWKEGAVVSCEIIPAAVIVVGHQQHVVHIPGEITQGDLYEYVLEICT